jgi:hypothetical protein
MSEFKFACEHCGQHLQCDEQLSGRQIQCPKCQHLIRIPPAPGKTVEYQPESGLTWATYVPPPNRREGGQTPGSNKGPSGG